MAFFARSMRCVHADFLARVQPYVTAAVAGDTNGVAGISRHACGRSSGIQA